MQVQPLRTARVRVRIKGTRLYMADGFTVAGATGSLPYDAAGQGLRARTWQSPQLGPNAALTYALSTLRARSRDAVRKNGLAESAVSVLVRNVIGTGIVPQFRTPDLGLNRELAELWTDWTDEADADGYLDLYGLQALAVRSIVEGGEAFVRFRTRFPGDLETVPFQIQLLESELCPVDRFEARPGREIRNGIEFDAIGRRRAYWMYRRHPNDWHALGGVRDGEPVPVPASEVAHLYEIRRPGQIRGEPWLVRALIKLRDLDAYDDAELMRKKIAALFAGFITRPTPEEGEWTGEQPGLMGEGAPDAGGVARAPLMPATLQVLLPGEEITFSEPADVGGNYEAFVRDQRRAVAVAAGVLYEQLSGDYSKINDRTFRAAVNEFRRFCQMLQHHVVVYQFCRPVGRRWLDAARLARLIRPPRGMDERAFHRVKWVPQGWSYIHPVQEVQAAREAVRAGFRSRAEVVSEQGYDVEAIDREIAEDNARADSLGNAYDSDGRQALRPRANPADDGEAAEGAGRDDADREREDEGSEEREREAAA